MGQLTNNPPGLETALLLADQGQKEIFRCAFSSLPDQRRQELEERGIFLVHEKRINGSGIIVYEFADNTEILVVPNSAGIIAAKATLPTCPIVEVNGVEYLTMEHGLSDVYPEDSRFGYSKLLAIARDLSPGNRLAAKRYVNKNQIQYVFLTGQIDHDLLGKFLLRQDSVPGYMEVPGHGRWLCSSETPSIEVYNFSNGLLQPMTK